MQALVRELGEETTLITQEADFKKIGAFSVVMSHNDEQLEISGECFQIDVSVGNNIKAKEGDIVKIHKTALFDRISEMSPATATAIEQYYVERK